MNRHRILAMLSLFVSAAALAQVYYPEPHPLYDGTLTRDELRECMYRDESLAARQDRIGREKTQLDAEADAVARDGDNRRVHDHNRRIADLNGRIALLNGDSARLDSLCARSYRPSDRDAILIERGRIR